MPQAGPRVGFLLGGVQKGGTTALARLLAQHPGLALPEGKEAHVFDAPDFDEGWSAEQVDARFAPHFDSARPAALHGDATPITLFHPTLVARVARYNPAMRWVLLLRDPVERAISHYFMERGRGLESRSLLAAVLLEHRRLRGHVDDWSADSPLRVCSYAARGRYAAQLCVLFEHFPREQVLLLRSCDMAACPQPVLARIWDFLGVAPVSFGQVAGRVFAGAYRPPPPWSAGRLALHWLLRGEKAALARQHGIDLN